MFGVSNGEKRSLCEIYGNFVFRRATLLMFWNQSYADLLSAGWAEHRRQDPCPDMSPQTTPLNLAAKLGPHYVPTKLVPLIRILRGLRCGTVAQPTRLLRITKAISTVRLLYARCAAIGTHQGKTEQNRLDQNLGAFLCVLLHCYEYWVYKAIQRILFGCDD